MVTSVVTLTELGKYMNEIDFSKTYKARFERLLRHYGYEATQSNVIEFLTLIVNKPDSFKKTDDIIKVWKKPRSIQDVFSCMIHVCNIPKIKERLGDRYDEVVTAYESYIKELAEATKVNVDNNVTVVVKALTTSSAASSSASVDQQYKPEYHCIPPSSSVDDDEYEDEHEHEDEGELENEYIDEPEYTATCEEAMPEGKKKPISIKKLMVYIKHLRNIGTPMTNMIADLMECDMSI